MAENTTEEPTEQTGWWRADVGEPMEKSRKRRGDLTAGPNADAGEDAVHRGCG